jgi:hypothetical protein
MGATAFVGSFVVIFLIFLAFHIYLYTILLDMSKRRYGNKP